ncbi:SDR family oxidoreductase [Aestuariivirga litoralis]|uniref:SDR family oxidoreductase n=1 Tax=Aestuariivirga litoralis TaxID=2650924 RepID=UPI0018C72A54|nr:SDR family oxidoreductase [Aestuariivirga litoralis]MBG1233526.1 SDR family oxidoreductase [Aestuariivirga litoralis]
MSEKTILITGCSSGIGYACAHGLKSRGWRVFATVRNLGDKKRLEAEGLEVLVIDYADSASLKAAVKDISNRTGGTLYALFNNGAYGQVGAVEDLPRAVLEKQFASNFFGWHELATLCLPLMRAHGTGRIVQCSSVLGIVAMKWRGAYNASKFAIEGLSDTMRLELQGSGIFVSTIEPGPIQSRFVESAMKAFESNIDETKSHYTEAYARQRARLGRGGSGRFKLGPEAVLEKLIHALEAKRPRAHYYVTIPTHIMGVARRIMPQRMLDWFVAKMSDQ